MYLSSLSAESIAECFVNGRTHPVLALAVDSPKANRIGRVCHVALTDASLLVIGNLVHIALDDMGVVISKFLTLSV